ncbi:T9SS type A sorting domain-containing protein [Polaribacter sp.]|uniref:T9SS type A sorting domain-containing protein n=1 Tax=Polaribacter sp. TaxID=1920175 RepID=UPI0040479014
MKKNYFLTLLSLLFCVAIQAQVTYSGNENSGFGGAIGNATMTINDDGTTVTCNFTKGAGGFNDTMVMYISNGSNGRNVINGDVNDGNDANRRAISNTGSGDLTFPAGFQATHAIAINTGFGGLWSIPSTGTIGNNGLGFVAAVGQPATSSTASFSFTFTWANIGLTRTDKFEFVITYGNPNDAGVNMFSSDEAFGDGIAGGNPGLGAMTFTNDKSYPNTWTGTTDSDWATATNWTEGVPSALLSNVYIPAVTNQPISLTPVTINKGIIKSGASFLADATFTGTMTYERNLVTPNWYLVSSPLSGQAMNDGYITANNIANGNVADNRGIATYTTASNTWSYFQAGGNSTFDNGTGYSVKRATAGNILFTGTMNTTNSAVTVSNAGNGFNLIGNPFTTNYQSSGFLTNNSANLVSETIWVWNQATSNYETYSTVDAFILAPTQGFFVRSSNGTNLNFNTTFRTNTAGTFQKSARTEVKILMNDGSADRFAKMYYLDNVTKGFDNGFDGETFGGVENSVDVFTNLVENNEGKKFQVQSLPIADMETMIVHVGVKAAAGKEITFTAEAMNLPGETKVFLEDRLTNTITRLDEANTSYKVTLNDALNGTGRFFLHTKASGVLSTDEVVLQNTSVYAINNNTLRIVGLPSGIANIKMYNILGKQVMQTSFSSTGVKEISLPKLATGMYIIQLETATGKLNKKIVLE